MFAKKGDLTRTEILSVAMDLASLEGLEGLTIGRLATEVGMSKSGLFAHFGSKQGLQLATVEAARGVAAGQVLRPGIAAGTGLVRVRKLLEGWISYMEREVFRGGCFFAAASAEVDGRRGPVRDLIVAVMKDWLGALETALAQAVSSGELLPQADPRQLAFELNAMVMGANWAVQLLGDSAAYARARCAIRSRLETVSSRRTGAGEPAR